MRLSIAETIVTPLLSLLCTAISVRLPKIRGDFQNCYFSGSVNQYFWFLNFFDGISMILKYEVFVEEQRVKEIAIGRFVCS